MKVRLLMVVAVLVMGLADASAAPMGPSGWQGSAPRGPTTMEAGAVVRRGMDELMGYMAQKPRPTGLKLAAFLEDKIAGYFDFEFMARMALGPRYRRMSGDQIANVVQQIEQDFLGTLTRHLASFDNQKIRYFRPRHGRGNRAMVTVGITNPGTYPTRLDFRLYRQGGDWKVYDVVANGNSAVNYYRQKFARSWQRPMPYGGRV